VFDFDVRQLILDNGEWFYAITFIWTFLEGESFVIIAGAMAAQGALNIYVLTLVAWIGSFCGDQLYFFLGRKFGRRIVKRWPRVEGGVNVALHMLHKRATIFILTYRFIYGVRNFASLAMGMSELPWIRFAMLNFVAAFIWAVSFAWSGYLLGIAFEAVLGDIANNFGYFMLGMFALVLTVVFIVHRRAKVRYKRQLAAEAARHPSEIEEIIAHPEEVEKAREGDLDWIPDIDKEEAKARKKAAE
jgi:membrane protein DedA with SNARE-associated domain